MSAKDSSDMLRSVFDAIPSLIFVVDDDVRIQEYNAAAARLLLAERDTILKQRAGDILHCLHTSETAKGCGHALFCKKCIVRNSVTAAIHGESIVRKRSKMEIIQDGKTIEIYALITTSPFHYKGKEFVLLVIEDISEISELQRIIPICSYCRKIRDDKESWLRVEAYFKNNWDLDFSHALCPECAEKHYPEEYLDIVSPPEINETAEQTVEDEPANSQRFLQSS